MLDSLLLALVPLLCLWIDRCWGEPPARWHPVVWMGHYLQWAGERIAPRMPAAARATPSAMPAGTALGAAPGASVRVFLAGSVAWLCGACLAWLLAAGLQALLFSLPWWLQLPLLASCLKPMLAWAMLRDEARAVEAALQQSLPGGRERLGWLVSRDTRTLDATAVREATIETVAENLNDSVVAPLFWFVLLGLPGAVLYRFANTADAMWGYPGERQGRQWQWAGKWAARADDSLGWLPARLTALLLMAGAGWALWRRLPAEARRTPSPNGGWPMAAMALRLDVRLGKPGVYGLHDAGRPPGHEALEEALSRAEAVVWMSALLAVAGIGVRLMA